MGAPDEVSKSTDLVGQTLGHFRIVSRIGEGGMGVVYRAVDDRLRRAVALKVLPDEAMRDEARRRRFLREARSAAAVMHANVATVHEVDEVDGRVYIAMELVTGSSLRDELARGRLSLAECTRIARGIARALAKAHEKGIVHRDLKPDNVMLNEDREVKVLDFGLAKLLEVESGGLGTKSVIEMDETASYDTVGRLVGTPAYMSPEQATGRAIEARSDVFSFGVVLYEMLAGERPFHGVSPVETLVAVSRDEAPPVKSLVPLPPSLEAVLARCLKKKPEDRFASGRELALALESLESGAPSMASAPSYPRDPPHARTTGETVTKESQRPTGRHAKSARRARIAAVVAGGAFVVAVAWIALHPAGARVVGSEPSAHLDASPARDEVLARAETEEREGRHDLACADYERASNADPSAAIAAFQAALCHLNEPRAGRVYFRRAWPLRAILSPRDAALLDAYEPVFQRDPEDDEGSRARLEALVKRFPDDARAHYYLASAHHEKAKADVWLTEFERSLALDPQQPRALLLEADDRAYTGDFAGAKETTARCLAIAPGSLTCIEEQIWIDGAEGACASVEAGARRMLSVEPKAAEAARYLANALLAEGSSIAAMRELLHRKRQDLPETSRADVERADEVQLDVLAGDFASAEAAASALASDLRASPIMTDHGRALRRLVDIDVESGRTREAAAAATTYLEGRDAWEPNARFEDWAMASEPTPLMLGVRLHAGAITRADHDREIARTLERWETRVEPALRDFIWVYAYAVPTETSAEAAVAMTRRADYEPVPPFAPLSLVEADVGRTYFLAGKIDEAIPVLERATRACFPLDHAVAHTRAHYFLGLAREAKGDTAGACAAYRVVVDRWGSAKPRSITAERAVARRAALHCEPASR